MVIRRFVLTLIFVLTLATPGWAQVSYPPPTIKLNSGTADVCFETQILSPLTMSNPGDGTCSIDIASDSISAGELGANCVEASELASTAIQPGDIGLDDLPADAYATVARASFTNDTSTGTLTNGLVKFTGAPSKVVRTGTTDVGGAIGICVSGCGTSSSGTIQFAGPASCVFENATTAGNYVGIGTGTAGNCRDVGSTYPVTGQVIGRVTETAAAGTRSLVLWGVDLDPVFSRFGPTVEPSEIAAPFTMLSGNTLDGNSGSNAASWLLPRKTDCSGVSSEGAKCWDSDNDVDYTGTGSAALAACMNPTQTTLVGNIGATGELLKFGNDTAKFRVLQSASNTFFVGLNTQVNGARDDTGVGGAGIQVGSTNFRVALNGAFGPLSYLEILNTNIAGLYMATITPTLSFGIRGSTARTLGVERNDVANTAGASLTVLAGGATSGATDKAGGPLLLRPGVSTGTGDNAVKIQGYSRAVSTGTSDNSINDRLTITGAKGVTDNSATDLVDINIPSNSMMGGLLLVTCESTNGTEYQAVTSKAMFAGVNKGGVMTCTATEDGADVVASSSGTPTLAFSATTGTAKCVLRITCDGTVTTTGYPRASYQVQLNSGFAATVSPL